MERNQEFLKLLEACRQALEANRDAFVNAEEFRWKRMKEEVDALIDVVRRDRLHARNPYLLLVQMIDRNDPESVIQSVLTAGKYYQDYYYQEEE